MPDYDPRSWEPGDSPGYPADRVPASSEPRKITHGRHCICSACAAEDWTNPRLACCGMHGPSCPREYQPLGAAGQRVPSSDPRPENPYRTVHARMSPPGAAWDEGFASRQPEIDRLEAERDAVIEVCAAKIRERDAAIAAGQPLAEIVDYLLRCFPDDAKAEAALAAWRSVSGSSEPPKESA